MTKYLIAKLSITNSALNVELRKVIGTLKHEVQRVPTMLEPPRTLLRKHCTYDADWNLPLCLSPVLYEFYMYDIKFYINKFSILTFMITCYE